MKMIYICSPLKGDIEGNIKKAVEYSRYAAEQGVIPLAPHTMFTQYLDDTIPHEREQGMKMGLELLKRCDELWAFGGRPSAGMLEEMKLAQKMGIPVVVPLMTMEKDVATHAMEDVNLPQELQEAECEVG